MKRVIFIQPPFERTMGYRRYYTHPGLLSLAAVVEKGHHQVLVYDADYDVNGTSYDSISLMQNYQKYIEVLDDNNSPLWQEIKEVVGQYRPEIVCVSILTVTQESAKRVIKIAKEINPSVTIVVGGVHPTIRPEECIGYADYVIRNEGENVILDIVNGILSKGIIQGTRVRDLDSLPFPAVHALYNLSNYNPRDLSMVISTRGCPNKCGFCCSSVIWNRMVTRKSVGYFVKEIAMLKNNYGISDFFICDDSFTYDQKWLFEFCVKIKLLNITWRCLCRLDMINEQIIALMKDAGCRNIKLGIESGSQRILDMVHKNIKVEDVYEIDKILSKSDIDWSAYFIVGFPEETIEDIRKTQRMISNISAKGITVSVFTPYPETELYEGTYKDSKYFSHHSPYNNFTRTINNEDFSNLVKETIQMASRLYQEH